MMTEKENNKGERVMMPEQLKDDRLRFCRVGARTKKPFEKDWTNKLYTWQEIQEFRGNGENYGVLCGHGGLIVIDCDNVAFVETVKALFPRTYSVKTGGGGMHFYYFAKPDLKKKMILILDDESKLHLGEVQTWGTQCVCEDSVHPNGNKYEMVDDFPIAIIQLDELIGNLKAFMPQDIKEISQEEIEELKKQGGDGGFENEPNVVEIWGSGFKSNDKGEYFGSHPVHSSTGGQNFWMNPSKNVWKCFRCSPHNSKLITPLGLKNIQDLKKGDDVFGQNFQKNKIIHTSSRIAKEPIYEIKTFTPKIRFTEEHPIQIATIKYKDKHLVKKNPVISWKTPNQINLKKDFLVMPKQHHATKYLKLNKNQAKLLGWYLAEGHLPIRHDRPNNNCVQLTLGLKSAGEKIAKRLCKISKKFYGGTANYNNYSKRGTIIVNIFSKKLRQFIEKTIGTGSSKKELGDLIQAPLPFLKEMVMSYIEADGCFVKSRNQQRVSSVSENLIREVQIILFKLGIPARYYFISTKNNLKARNPIHLLQWIINPVHKSEFQDKDNLYLPIQSVYDVSSNERVYSIETQDHTYLSPYIVHNCDSGGSWMSAIAVKEGIIDCSGAIAGQVRGEIARRCIEIAKEKYGLIVKPIVAQYKPIGDEEKTLKRGGFILLTKFSPKPFADELMKFYEFKYDNYHRFWVYDFNEGIWKEDAEDFVKNILRKNSLGDEQQKDHYATEIVKHLQQWNWTREMPDDMDKGLVAFKNCLANIETGEFLPFSSKYFITTKLDVEIDPKFTECPKINKFFEEVVGLQNKSILYDMIAYCFTRQYYYQKMFIMWGRGQNGKTTFLDLLTRILGIQNISSETPQDLVTSEFSKGELFGKFANISSELPYTSIQDTNVIKALCGGDMLKCNRKYKQPFQFRSFAKLIFSGNELPSVTDKTLAWARRLYIIKFDKVIKDPIKNYLDLICTEEEMKGLAWRCFQKLRLICERGWEFEIDVNPEEMMNLYEDLSDPLKKFLREETTENVDYNDFIFKWEFKQIFQDWCKYNGFRVWGDSELGKAMKDLYPESRRSVQKDDTWTYGQEPKRYMAWQGLKWRKRRQIKKEE